MTTWAEKIKALESRGWSLTKLAQATDASVSAISDVKHERTAEPKGMTAVELHHLYSTGQCPPNAKHHS